MSMSDRPKGVVVYESALNPIAEAAEQHQKQLQEERRIAAAERAARPVPNYICYPSAFEGLVDENGNWLGKGTLPRCRVCEERLDPKENHKCPGFTPKYSERSREERRAILRAAWEEAGDWDDDQYDPTTPDPDFSFAMHEAETGETRDQVALEGWDEDRWIAWKKKQLGHAPDYDPYFESDDFEDDGYEEE